MKTSNLLILSTSPTTLPARKPLLTTRALYRKTLRRYTGKERDSETGLYYYGARYLDSKTGRWLSGDPALGEYVPQAGTNGDELPGMGGVYNTVNLHLYHYAGNNPVLLKDPNGKIIQAIGDDGNTYTWDNEKNQFYSGRGNNKNYEINDGFVKDVQDSLNYLKGGSEYADQIISDVSSSNRNATIKQGNTSYITEGRNIRINFSPRLALELNDDTDSYMSPATGLFHEISHAYSHLVENKLSTRTKEAPVGHRNISAEEENAMAMTNKAAQQLGEPSRVGAYTQAGHRFTSGDNYVRQFRNNQK